MRGPHNIFRLFSTLSTFERSGATRVALDMLEAPRSLKIVVRVVGWPFQWFGLKGDPSKPPVLRAITALGPVYIKFGQLLSTRPDVVGTELAAELSVLLDRLPPFSLKQAKQSITHEIGQETDELFAEFSEPVAAASIAQVHKARLKECGSYVAIKVLRPGIERAFQRDIDALYFAAGVVDLLSPGVRRLKPRDVIAHFEGVVLDELDLRLEASAADEFAAKCKDDTGISAPTVRWHLSSKRAMTMDWVEGINLGDVAKLRAAGHDMPALARRLLQMFLRSALRDGYFHADMHQGNIKVASDGTFMIMDYGIMGRIDEYTRRVYAEILMGFIRRDYYSVARVHFEAGYVPSTQNVEEFAQALRSVGEPIFGMEASQISMARLLGHLFEVTGRFGMETRTELILLQRTMVVVEGVGRTLDSDLNIWECARPIVENYIRRHVGPAATLREFAETARMLSRLGPRLPQLAETAIRNMEKDTDEPPASRQLKWFALGVLTAIAVTALVMLIDFG